MTATDCDLLILGASFAGIELYHQLRRHSAGRKLSVTIVDRQASHGYIPLCQERLVLRLPPARSELATQRCVQAPGARYLVDEVVGLDPAQREVSLASGARLRARFIVVALGSDLAPPPALPGREHLQGYKFAHEFAAAQARLLATLQRPARLVVIGGGISGVELAGELAHLARANPTRHPAGTHPPKVTLIDAGDRLLRNLTERAGRMAARELVAQGVDLRLRTRVLAVGERELQLHAHAGQPEALAHDLSFWAGGVRPVPVLAALGLPRTPGGWLAVGPTLQCFPEQPGSPIFACGDAVRVLGGTGEWPTMQRAIECLWQAKVVAHNLLALVAAGPGVHPELRPHALTADFPHGVSVGAASMIVYGRLSLELGPLGVWFRRFLMRQYFRRYGGHKVRPA